MPGHLWGQAMRTVRIPEGRAGIQRVDCLWAIGDHTDG